MVNLHKVNETFIQVVGEHERVSVTGIAQKVSINSATKVWQYNLKMCAPPRLVTLKSNPKESTMRTEKELLDRILKECIYVSNLFKLN